MHSKKRKAIKKYNKLKKKSSKKIKHAKIRKAKHFAKNKPKKIKHIMKKKFKKSIKSKHAKRSKPTKHVKVKKTKSFLKANLLVTYDPAHAGTAKEELAGVLSKINEEFEVLPQETQGLFEVKVDDARLVVKKAAELCISQPHLFRATFHWSPIDTWCKSEIKQMQDEIKKIVPGIKAGERWKMEINKRDYPKHFSELIIPLTEPVERDNVDLENPQKIIRVEIISGKAGISLLTPNYILDVPKIKKEKAC